MPVQSTDTNGLNITTPNEQWVIKDGVVINNENGNPLTIATTGARLLNHGDLSGGGTGPFAGKGIWVRSTSSNTFVFNDGSIIAPVGIDVDGKITSVFNSGDILGEAKAGISFNFVSSQPQLHNSGTIVGKTFGVVVDHAQGAVKLFNSGVIDSDGVGIGVKTGSGARADLFNSGTIKGAEFSLVDDFFGLAVVHNQGRMIGSLNFDTSAENKVLNDGLIRGDIVFHFGDNSYDGSGGSVSGTVFGGNGQDRLTGGNGSDDLSGDAGRDILRGGGGDDVLRGGDAADELIGGGGSDYFVLAAPGDSKGGFFAKTERDTVVDFSSAQGDRIDLHLIDANGKTGGDNRFHFIGTDGFSHARGELRYAVDHNDVLVQGDVNGNGGADFEIRVADVSVLHASDFVL